MNLGDSFRGHGRDEPIGIEAVVGRVDVDIIDVEQQLAAGAPHQRGDELPFGNRRIGERQVRRDVFDGDFTADALLQLGNTRACERKRLLGVGQRQQVVQVPPADSAPAQMLGDERGLDPFDQRLELCDVRAIEGLRRRQRHADTVQ